MRQNDYERYRHFCSVKLHRLCKKIGFIQRKGKAFEKKSFDEKSVKNANSLFYPLLNAERAWAYSNELKEQLNDTRESRIQYHLVSRIRKACKWSSLLLELCRALADDRTVLESDAYHSYMQGTERMESGDWVAAKALLNGRKARWSCFCA